MSLAGTAVITTILINRFWGGLFRYFHPEGWSIEEGLLWRLVRLSLSPFACLAICLLGLVRLWRLAPLRHWTFGHLAAVEFCLLALRVLLEAALSELVETSLPIPPETWDAIYSATYRGLEIAQSLTIWIFALLALTWAGFRIARWSKRSPNSLVEPGGAADGDPD